MQKSPEAGDLEIAEDLEFQRRTWVFERAGWIVFAIIVAAAMAGLFGRGLLGVAVAATDDARLSVEYHRFWRMQSPMTLRIRADASTSEDGRVRVWIGRPYLQTARLSHVLPEPESVEAGPDRIVFVFALTSDATAADISLDLEPETPGYLRGRAGIEGGPQVAFAQFFYP